MKVSLNKKKYYFNFYKIKIKIQLQSFLYIVGKKI